MPDRYLGRTIGKYRVIRHLGTGTFSWVYEAVDLDLQIPVALKILRPEFAGHPAAEDRVRREAATAARLRHPNIVTVRDVGQVDGAPFVAMDLYPLTLARRLQLMGHLPEPEVVRLGIGIAAALAVAHASDVVHRDIKPDNILLDPHGEAVVGDFGLARALAAASDPEETSRIQGTPHYFSPEQSRGHQTDGRSDLYSLGVTLYRAATGVLPFDGDDWYDIARQHVETPPPPPRSIAPELTPAFERLLLRLLAKAPAERFPGAAQLVDALAALPTAPDSTTLLPRRGPHIGSPIGSRTVDALRLPPSRPSRRWPRTAAVITGALIAAIVWGRRHGQSSAPKASVTVPPGDTVAATTGDHRAPADRPAGDTAGAAAVTRAPPRPALPGALTARLEIATTDSAAIYVDNRLVGTGRWSGDLPPGSPVQVRAVVTDAVIPDAAIPDAAIPDAAIPCRTALRDTVVAIPRAGQRARLDIPVRACALVRFRIDPRDARVQFTPLDEGRVYETRADSAESYALPVGRYLLRISAPYCMVFSDTVVVTRATGGASGGAIVPRKLVCS